VNLTDDLWPDCDNTLRALDDTSGGLVQPHPTLPALIQAKARATIDLTGLDKDPGNPNAARRPTRADQRWLRRQQTWEMAERCRDLLMANNSAEVRELITKVDGDRYFSRGSAIPAREVAGAAHQRRICSGAEDDLAYGIAAFDQELAAGPDLVVQQLFTRNGLTQGLGEGRLAPGRQLLEGRDILRRQT
jgi:hypothetical protein